MFGLAAGANALASTAASFEIIAVEFANARIDGVADAINTSVKTTNRNVRFIAGLDSSIVLGTIVPACQGGVSQRNTDFLVGLCLTSVCETRIAD